MPALLRKLLSSRSTCFLKRALHNTSNCHTYEGDGKTTVTILNKNYDYGLMIDNISEQGFILNNGIRTIGPMIIFPKTLLSWNISSSQNMNEESFSLLLNLDPILDVVVIGLDDEYPYNAPFLQNIKDIFRKHKILTEILPTYRASATFNYLNSERRYVAGALIPPRIKTIDHMFLEQKEKKILPNQPKEEEDPLLANNALQVEIDEQISAEDLVKNKKLQDTFEIKSPWKYGKSDEKPEPTNSSKSDDKKSNDKK